MTNFFYSPKSAWFWLIVRVYLGWQWLEAGWGKLHNSTWLGSDAGASVSGFLHGALTKMGGTHPDVSSWYGWFINHVALPHAVFFSYVITFGEILVGVALILGLFTVVATYFGAFMNFNYLFAGTVSSNPWLLLLSIFLIMARKVAGRIGLDFFVQPIIIQKMSNRG